MASEVKNGIPAPGWSDRVNDPEILAGLERRRKSAFRWTCIGIVLALAAPPLVSKYLDTSIAMGEACKIGCVIAGIIALCSFLGKLSRSAKNAYEGEVTDKREEIRHKSGKNSDSYRIEYVTYVRKTDGDKEKIKESRKGAVSAWEYLKVGDRFKYHPQFAFRYELYDKSKAEHLFCPVCAKKNPVESDRCSRCHVPLLK